MRTHAYGIQTQHLQWRGGAQFGAAPAARLGVSGFYCGTDLINALVQFPGGAFCVA